MHFNFFYTVVMKHLENFNESSLTVSAVSSVPANHLVSREALTAKIVYGRNGTACYMNYDSLFFRRYDQHFLMRETKCLNSFC